MAFMQRYKTARGRVTIIATCAVAAVGIVALALFVLHAAQGYTVKNIDDLTTHVCDGGQKIKNAAVYTGNAPHYMRVGIESAVLQVKPNLTAYPSITTPQSSAYVGSRNLQLTERQFKFLREDVTGEAGQTQLVGCVSRVQESDAGQKCKYDTGTLEVFKAQYKLDVYVAKTHKLLQSTKLNAIPMDQFSCPPSVYYSLSAARVYVPYDSSQFLDILEPFVSGAVRT